MPRKNQRNSKSNSQSGRRKPKPIKFNASEIQREQYQLNASNENINAIDVEVNNGSTFDKMDNENNVNIINNLMNDETNISFTDNCGDLRATETQCRAITNSDVVVAAANTEIICPNQYSSIIENTCNEPAINSTFN